MTKYYRLGNGRITIDVRWNYFHRRFVPVYVYVRVYSSRSG